MKVVTLCGSMRFANEMMRIALDLELNHECAVLQCSYNIDNIEINPMKLAKSHMRKIDMSDAIYVVNINDYIGESVRSEIKYATEAGKEVMYHENRQS